MTLSFREDFILRLQIHSAAMRISASEFIEYCVNYYLSSPDVKTVATLLEAIGREQAAGVAPQGTGDAPDLPKYPQAPRKRRGRGGN